MKNSNWEELVDAYVDDECSPQERESIEARLRDDADAKAYVDWALKLRARLASTCAKTPPEFSQRLTSALNESDVWRRYGDDVRARRTNECARRMKWGPAVVGASAAAIALVAFGLAYNSLRSVPESPHSPQNEFAGTNQNVPSPNRDLQDSALARPPIQTPSPAGVQVANGERTAVQESLLCVVLLDNSSEHKSLNNAIRAKCVELNVNFMKFDSNRELVIEKASPQAWRELQQTLEANGAIEISDALQAWSSDGAENDLRDVRVSIKLDESTSTDASEEDK